MLLELGSEVVSEGELSELEEGWLDEDETMLDSEE